MKRNKLVSTLVVSLSVIACAQPEASEEISGGPCMLPDSDVEWIRNLVSEHESQVLSGDYDAMAESFSEDVVLMFPNQPSFVGRGPLREFQSAFPPIDEYELPALELIGCRDLAVVRGAYSMSMTIEGMEGPFSDSGNWMHVLRKGPDGSWKIIMDISNSDRPAPTG